MSRFVIECREKMQIPGHGWLVEGYVREGIAFPGADMKMVNVAGERVLIGTIMAFIHDDDLVDFVMEGQNCGILLRYLDLTQVEVEGLQMIELQEAV